MSNWKVGDRVQDDDIIDNKAVIYTGVITEINTAEKEIIKYDFTLRKDITIPITVIENMKVKWDDGEEELVGEYDVYGEDSEVERQFRMTALEVEEKIQKKLAIASKALDEAERLSEKYGVPFTSNVSPISQSYFPGSTRELHPDVSTDFVTDVTGAYHSDYGDEGWQHSAVC